MAPGSVEGSGSAVDNPAAVTENPAAKIAAAMRRMGNFMTHLSGNEWEQ
ncbi:hypothetical protein GCM10027088_50150 [Nocardia goodfellowii]